MEIKGSGNKYYEVDLNELTCTCRDWTCRKHNFPKGDKRRLCKHLIEAIELNTLIPQTYPTKLADLIPFDKNEVMRLVSTLNKDDAITSVSVCGEYHAGKTYQSDYLPIVIQVTYNIPYDHFDKLMKSLNYDPVTELTYGTKRYYNGRNPLQLIISTTNEYLFKTIYHDLGRDGFMKLCSLCIRKLGLSMTEIGFMNKNKEIVDMDVSTEEELCDLLGLRSLVL
jgi:hypothetical protein